MERRYDTICDHVDAGVFSGELVSNKDNRDGFKTYLARWSRAVEDATPPSEKKPTREELRAALKGLIPHMTRAFNAEGDTFGVYHNDAEDALSKAEHLIRLG